MPPFSGKGLCFTAFHTCDHAFYTFPTSDLESSSPSVTTKEIDWFKPLEYLKDICANVHRKHVNLKIYFLNTYRGECIWDELQNGASCRTLTASQIWKCTMITTWRHLIGRMESVRGNNTKLHFHRTFRAWTK